MVGPGNPPRRNPPRAATHSASSRHRLVALATRTSGRCATLTPEAQNAAVMLVAGYRGASFQQERQRRDAHRTVDDRTRSPPEILVARIVGWHGERPFA